MEINKKESISNLTSQVQALNNLQNDYFNLMMFVNDIKDALENNYNSKTENYKQEGINEVLNIVENQIDCYSKNSADIKNGTYYINSICKDLTDKIQKEVISI